MVLTSVQHCFVGAQHKWNLFLELMRWAEGGTCRHDAILRYFGDEVAVLQSCGRCDVCQALGDDDPAAAEDVSLVVRKALSGVARAHRRPADPRSNHRGLTWPATVCPGRRPDTADRRPQGS